MTDKASGHFAQIIADPDCCAASKAIAREALREEALTELVQLGQEVGDYGEPRCQPQDTAQWTKAELEAWCLGWCRTPHTTLKAFIDAGFCSDQEPSREEMRLLRQPDTSAGSMTKPVTHYRGWSIHEDRSCPDVGSTFRAFAPDYDPEQHMGGTYVTAKTFGDLRLEIDLAIEEAITQPAPYTCKHGCERDALKDRIAELVKALRAFAAVAEHDIGEDEADSETFRPMATYNRAPTLTVGDLRRARALLARAHTAAEGGE